MESVREELNARLPLNLAAGECQSYRACRDSLKWSGLWSG